MPRTRYLPSMHAYRTEATISKAGMITLQGIPFSGGESVEVIILPTVPVKRKIDQYPLRGTPFTFHHPFDPVSSEDWLSVS